LLDDTQTPGDGATTNRTIAGQFWDSTYWQSVVAIELDVDGDGLPAELFDPPQGDGRFTWTPSALAYGAAVVRARVHFDDWELNEQRLGPWTTFAFVYEPPPNAAPTVASFLPTRDSAPVGDGRTTDPHVFGTIANDGPVGGLTVEIDWDADGAADATTTTTAAGAFAFDLSTLPFGSAALAVRAVEYDAPRQSWLASGWSTLNFIYDPIPANDPPAILAVGLVNDTGTAGDGRSHDGRIVVTVGDDRTAAGLVVFVDWNQDGAADVSATAAADGTVVFPPFGVAPGAVVVAVWTREWDDDRQAWQQSAVATWSFELLADQPPTLAAVGVEGGEWRAMTAWQGLVAPRPTIVGSVESDSGWTNVLVDVDWTGDGTFDQS
ncbi:MAG: hypothetical protein ACRDD1_16450, partial [Planctomycetia bacterium]